MLGGTVSDFDAAQPSMQTVLAREADTSTDAVYLMLTAGSVIVQAEIYFGTADGATFAVEQLLASIFASPAALETALNIQFEEDLVGVTASVQQILAAPEYDAGEANLIGIGVGVGVGAVLLLVVGGVVLDRMRKKTAMVAQSMPAAQAVQLAPLPQVVQAQVVEAVEVAPPMCQPVAGTSYPQVPADAPPLLTMVEHFKRQLGLDMKLNMQEVVEQACVQLGVDATQGNLVEKAEKCWVLLGCPRS